MFHIRPVRSFVLLAAVVVSLTICSGQAPIAKQPESASSSNPPPELAPSSRTEADMMSNRIASPQQFPATNATSAPENKILGFTDHDFVWFIGGALVAILFFMVFFQRQSKSRK